MSSDTSNSAKYGLVSSGGLEGVMPVTYYLSLITSEYQSSPNFLAWVTALLQKLDDVSQCIATLDDGFDLDQAVGTQLDILGQIVGVTRTVGFQPSNGVSPVLDDDAYRMLLRAKIGQNQWDGQLSSLQPLWQYLFPNGRIRIDDQQNMTVTTFLTGEFTSIIQDLIINGYIVPRPEGVLINLTLSQMPILGFDQNNNFVGGFDIGHFC